MIPVGMLVRLPGFEGATLTVERLSQPTTPDYRGRPTVAAATEVPIYLVSHPSSRQTIQRAQLDESRSWRSFYSESALYGATDNSAGADVIQHGGERWEVQTVGDYGTLGGIWLALAQRIE